MKILRWTIGIFGLATAITGCAALELGDHGLRARLEVPAGVPFELVLTAVDDRNIVLTGPALGFASVTVPATRPTGFNVRTKSVFDVRKVRIQVPPLNPGVYEVACDCHIRTEVARVVVD